MLFLTLAAIGALQSLSTISIIGAKSIYDKWAGQFLSARVEGIATETMAIVDRADADLELVEDAPRPVRVKPYRPRFMAQLVILAKVKFGLLVENEANRLMLRKYLRDVCEQHGLRPSHASAVIDPAVSLCFVPSEAEILAAELRFTRAARTRKGKASRTYRSWFQWLQTVPPVRE